MSKTKEQQPTYISRVHLKGYKSIRDLEIDFKAGLNIIIGPNGSGKTNFLEFMNKAFHLQVDNHTIRTKGVIDYFKDDRNLKLSYSVTPNKKQKDAQDVDIDVSNSEGKVVFDRAYLKIGNREIYNKESDGFYFFNDDSYNSFLGINSEKNLINLINFGVEERFKTFLNSSFSVDFESGDVNGEHSDERIIEIIGAYSFNNDKSKILNLAVKTSFLSILKSYSPIDNLKFDISDAKIAEKEGHYDSEGDYVDGYLWIENLKIKFSVANQWLSWDMLSDGTKRIFYLLFSIFVSKSTTILLEEPELGIHPDQLYKLMDFLKEQSKEKQIIITTHSPEVLNILEKDELDRIIVTRYDAEKGTQMHHLSPHKIKKGVSYMSKEGLALKDFWVHSNLEEYEAEEYEVE
jgi:AAA15 family ATPase/GTPase